MTTRLLPVKLPPNLADCFARAISVCAVLILTSASGQEGYALWAKTRPNAADNSMALSPSGEIVVGAGSIRFDHLDSGGSLVRTTSYAGTFFAALTFDAAGNRYLAGTIETNENGYFDSSQVRGFAVAKFNAQDQLVWVSSQNVDDPQWSANASAITVDGSGNVFAGGYAKGPVRFGAISFGNGEGPVMVKYDAGGTVLWARRVEHQSSGQYPYATVYQLRVDRTGHIVVCGALSEGTADFGGTTVFPGPTGVAGGDWFLARYKPNGDLDWVQLGFAKDAVTDKQGNIFVTWGRPLEGTDGIAKFDTNGVVLWSKTFSPLGAVYTMGIALDSNDEPVFTGEFSGTANFGTISLTARSATDPDFFVAKADASGNIRWALSGGGTGRDQGLKIAVDQQGNVLVAGTVRDAIGTFEGFPLPLYPDPYGTTFIAKVSPTPPIKIARATQNVSVSWPVKATNYVLEAATSLPAAAWETITNTATVTTRERSVQLPLTGNARFFRLRRP